MDSIIRFFYGITENQVYSKWIFVILIAFTVFIICVAIYFLLTGIFDPVRKRLYLLTGSAAQSHTVFGDTFGNLGNHFVSDSEEKLSHDRQRLLYAGFHKKSSLANYYSIKAILTVVLTFIAFVICSILPGISLTTTLIATFCGFALGLVLPSLVLEKKVKKRQRLIRNTFPDAIDQLIVCTEAGLGLDAGLQRVARDTALSNIVMSNELGLVNAEVRAGIARDKALKNLVTRTGVEEIRGFVNALSQSMHFGSNISETLRLLSDELRDKRIQKAEEEAAKLAIKMIFPLGFCFFPGLYIVILGPAFIQIYKSLIQG